MSGAGRAGDLLDATAALVAIASPSHGETELADHVEARLRNAAGLEVSRVGDNVVARTATARGPRLLLAGHLDTVPANGNAQPVRGDGVLRGLGSADMKGGLAVMLDLAASSDVLERRVVDLTFVFYVCEEVARAHNGLLQLWAARPDLLEADAAVLGEPTGAVVEAGCQGTLRVGVTLAGRRAHTARPWTGDNAIHRLAPVLAGVAAYEGRRPVIDGCTYREALQAVAVEGGVAANVVPDRVALTLNHRFAPDRTAEEAFEAVTGLVAGCGVGRPGDEVALLDVAPAARPALDHPLLAGLVSLTGAPPRAKLGWTDVAFFAERGIPATNFGPGDPEVAHTADEQVVGEELERVSAALRSLVAG